jgi:hypothetical protein
MSLTTTLLQRPESTILLETLLESSSLPSQDASIQLKPQQPSLTTLPPELLSLILTHLLTPAPTSLTDYTYATHTNINALRSLRLTSTFFSTHALIFNLTFSHLLTTWLDPKESHRTISHLASQICYCIHGGKWNVWGLEGVANDDGCEEEDIKARVEGEERVFEGVVRRLVGNGVGRGSEKVGGREGYSEDEIRMGLRRLRLCRMLGRMEEW